MKKTISFILITMLISACKTPCDTPDSLSRKVADPLISKWNCKNPDIMHADIDAWFAERSMCSPPTGKQGLISDIVCPLITGVIRRELANQVPTRWGCDTNLIGVDAAGGANALCQLIPF